MKKILALMAGVALLFTSTIFTSCSDSDDDDSKSSSTGLIVGYVLDNKGEPVEGATVTLGNKTTTTNKGGEYELTGITANDLKLVNIENDYVSKPTGTQSTAVTSTAYKLTVTKEGYLPALTKGIYVTHDQVNRSAAELAALQSLQTNYTAIVTAYANKVATTTNTTSIASTTAGTDATALLTSTNSAEAIETIANALAGLKDMYAGMDYETEWFNDFAESFLIPLDAKLSGSIKLTTSAKAGDKDVFAATTFLPTTSPKVKLTVKNATVAGATANETFEATVDAEGKFSFEKLPSGVALKLEIEAFEETKDNKICHFSSESFANLLEGSTYTKATDTINLDSGASNVQALSLLLFNQTDKLWVVETNLTKNSSAALLNPKDAITFKFSQPVESAELLTTIKVGTVTTNANIQDVTDKAYTAAYSTDRTEVTFTPNDGSWTEAAGATETNAILKVKAADNTTSLLESKFPVCLDSKIWVSITESTKDEPLAGLTSPVVLTFSKAMKSASVKAGETNNPVTLSWNTEKTQLTVTPTTYWNKDGTTYGELTFAVDTALSEDGCSTVKYWKLNSDNGSTGGWTGLKVFFNNKIYVSITESAEDNTLLGLTSPVVLTFSKAVKNAVVTAKCNGTALTNAYTQSWNEGKTQLTLTPKTFWDKVSKDNGEVDFTVTATAEDGSNTVTYWKANSAATGLKAFFDTKIDVTLAKVSDKAFTLTFSKAIADLTADELKAAVSIKYAAVKADAENSNAAVTDFVTAFDSDNKVLTITAKNDEFENAGYYAVTLTNAVVGKTGEVNLQKFGTKTADTRTYTTDFTLGSEFKDTEVTIVDSLPAGALASRAVYADASKYVKLSFSKNVAKSALTIGGKSVTNYILGKDVYLPLATSDDDTDVKLNGTVTAVTGQTVTKTDYVTGYKVSKVTYKMMESSLYTQKASIAGGTNDATVTKIKPTDSITFTFDQDVTAATWTAELYDKDNVGKKNLDQTLYKVTATAAAKVVTVALAEGSKALVNGETYYLSLKAVKKVGDESIVLYDSNASSNYGYIAGSTDTTLDSKIINTTVVTGKKYIEVNTEAADAKYENLYVVKAGKNSSTTAFEDFAKSNTSAIVLEFSEDITGFTGVLANTAVDAGKTADDVVNTSKYASTYTAAGKVLTITPTFAFPSGSTVYPIVFNAEGKVVKLVDVAGSAFIDDTNKFISRKFTESADIDKVIAGTAAAATKALALTQIDGTKKTANKQEITFKFSANISETAESYGTYKLYRKVTSAVPSADKWELAGTYNVGGSGTDTTALKYVKSDKAGTVNAVNGDFTILKKTPCITVKATEKEFDYAKTSSYRLVQTIDNVDIYSAIVTVEDNTVIFGDVNKTLITVPTDYTAESTLCTDDKEITIQMSAYLKEEIATPTLTLSTANGRPTSFSENYYNKAGKVTVSVGEDRRTVILKIKANTTACKGDKIIISATDIQGATGETTIVLE
ncbi:carboxypeptidase-like regulatory domain-containing protein [uncultured Treponema sp.]|uniref:carboxypeptidase-like regulatory domain-containing protein n=1 Tax=uncultured Treponema sp. TaxID=162155 RepID=UPI0025DAA4AB|nr:carboxypeptidase-like regulatory domain-containing protein [uncultured Treponema sp.]